MSTPSSDEQVDDYMSTDFLTKITGEKFVEELQVLPDTKSTKVKWLEAQIKKAKKEKNYKKASQLKRELSQAEELESSKDVLSKSLIDEDKNSIALKMMRKMGFEKGKGLGKTEQGVSEPISVALDKVIAIEAAKEVGLSTPPKQTIGFKSKVLKRKEREVENENESEEQHTSTTSDFKTVEIEYVQRMKNKAEKTLKRRKGISEEDEDEKSEIDYDFI